MTGRCGPSMATSTPNLVKMSEIVAELWRFSFFQNGSRPLSWILIVVKNDVTACCGLPPCKIWWQYLIWRPSYCDFPFFKMAAGRHLRFVQPTYRTTHDGALAVLSVLSNFVLIRLIVSNILKIQFFLLLAWNRLTTPTFGEFYGVLMPWTIFSHRNPQKANPWVKLCRLRYRSWKSVRPILL